MLIVDLVEDFRVVLGVINTCVLRDVFLVVDGKQLITYIRGTISAN